MKYQSPIRSKIKLFALGIATCLSIVISTAFNLSFLEIIHPTAVIAQISPVTTQDPVLAWNTLALDLIRTEKTSAPMAARNLAIAHAAIYDAVNTISQTHQPYLVQLQVSAPTSPEAAAATAAYQSLRQLYPKQVTRLDQQLEESLAKIPEDQAKTGGIELGKSVAEQILAWRKDDGSDQEMTYTPTNQPGFWQPVPPDFKSASMLHWKSLKPFALKDVSQFRVSQMPSLTSAEYTSEFNQTLAIGAKESTTRTADQTVIAKFWLDGNGTVTSPGHWNQIAASVAARQGKTLQENARLFALLNIALADASIIDCDHKYTFQRWRPITAIHKGVNDGNLQMTADSNWTPLLNTPNTPAYVSGHSTFGGAADVILTAFFGNNIHFETSADPATNLPSRTFKSFSEAAVEAGMSRIYGGVHWLSDNRDGLVAGRKAGTYVMQNFLRPVS